MMRVVQWREQPPHHSQTQEERRDVGEMEIAVNVKVCHLIKTKRGKAPISRKESRTLTR